MSAAAISIPNITVPFDPSAGLPQSTKLMMLNGWIMVYNKSLYDLAMIDSMSIAWICPAMSMRPIQLCNQRQAAVTWQILYSPNPAVSGAVWIEMYGSGQQPPSTQPTSLPTQTTIVNQSTPITVEVSGGGGRLTHYMALTTTPISLVWNNQSNVVPVSFTLSAGGDVLFLWYLSLNWPVVDADIAVLLINNPGAGQTILFPRTSGGSAGGRSNYTVDRTDDAELFSGSTLVTLPAGSYDVVLALDPLGPFTASNGTLYEAQLTALVL